MRAAIWAVATLAAIVAASVVLPGQAGYDWHLPPGFPVPPVPADNPMSAGKVALGRHLFYDVRLSGNRTQSCASCHQQSLAFADGRPVSIGSTGERHPRGSMSLANVAYAASLTWANPTLTALEDQALVPMFGEHPVELGLATDDRFIDLVRSDRRYAPLFRDAFPGDADPYTRRHVLMAMASFQRTLISGRSPYDRYHFERDDAAISAAARRGEVLFHSRQLSCFTCHGGFNMSGTTVTASRPSAATEFHNTGLYNLAGALSYPASNTGIYELTHVAADVGKFKPPTLRNIAVTAPYMHDGSVATLDEAIDHYAAGGRTISGGPHQGVGRDNPNKSPTLRGFTLSPEQRVDLVAFLESLTDEAFLHDPRFSNPWTGDRAEQDGER